MSTKKNLLKLIILIICIIFVPLSYAEIQLLESDNDLLILTENITITKPTIQKTNGYISLEINETGSYFIQTGRPLLPLITRTFAFPLGTKIIDVSVELHTEIIELSAKIFPCPVPIFNNDIFKIKTDDGFIDEKVYISNTFYPKHSYFITEKAGLNHDKHVLFCNIHIVPQYLPFKNIVLIPEEINITINYRLPQDPLFASNEEYDMVIIAPEKFSAEIQPLIIHKNSVGISTFIKSAEEIFIEYSGVDKPEQIKLFIKDAIENYGIKYVFLIGDPDHIPIRTTAVSWDYFGDLVVPNVITDLYYSDIYDKYGNLSIWDTNQDGVFSEICMIMNYEPYNETLKIIDEIEGVPDVIIGRLPCSNTKDVRNVIKKIITYETTTYGYDWFNRLILMGGDTFPYTGGISEGEFVTEYISSIMPDFEPIKLWTSLETFKPLNINLEISYGAGFVSYSGHGFEYGFATSSYNSNSPIFYYLPYIFGIINKERYPIMYFDACLTGAIDSQLYNINFPCLAWSMIKKHYGGAVACIGSTRVGFGGFAGDPFIAGTSCMHRYFFEAYEPGIHLGDMFIQAQQSFIKNIMNTVIYEPLTVQEFILLGDPSLKIGGYP